MGGEAEPLVPLLPPQDSPTIDRIALGTWREALSGAVGIDVPHDLFALWLLPSDGDAVLLGPAELEQDQLEIPRPSPLLSDAQLELLADIARDAGYGSATAVPIRFGQADVGLILIADLRSGRYGSAERAVLDTVARQLAQPFARLARRWRENGAAPSHPPLEDAAALVEALGQAAATARTPRDYARAISRTLDRVLPHERFELIVPGVSADQSYRVGAHGEGPLWSDPSLIVERAVFDVPGLFPGAAPMHLADTRRDDRWPPVAAPLFGALELRSVIGLRLILGERTVGYLLLGSVGPHFYQPADIDLLARVGPLVATRVDAFVQAWHLQTLRAQLISMQAVPAQLRRLAGILATAVNLPEALREFSAEATALLPFHRIRFAVRLNDDDRAAIFVPGETRALSDLPQAPITGTAIGRVLSGALPNAVSGVEPDIDLIFPLRVAGTLMGAMVLTTDAPDAFSRAHLTLAQQVADLLAPHLELLRRTSLLPGVYLPGWKRTPKL